MHISRQCNIDVAQPITMHHRPEKCQPQVSTSSEYEWLDQQPSQPSSQSSITVGDVKRSNGQIAVCQYSGTKWSRSWSRPIAVSQQYRSVSRRKTHHFGARWRSDYFNADWFNSLLGIGWWFDGASLGALHYGHANLPTFTELPADCGASWCRTQSNTNCLVH